MFNIGFVIAMHCVAICVQPSTANLQEKYIGCFRHFENQTGEAVHITEGLSIDLCVRECIGRKATYAGLQNSSSCFCGENILYSLPENNCSSKCPGNSSQYCGGSEPAYSIYAVCDVGLYGDNCGKICHCRQQAPCHRLTGKCPTGCDKGWEGETCDKPKLFERYIGCYKDNNTAAMDVKNPGGTTGDGKTINTIEVCLNICTTFNYTYIGTQYGYDCFCGESYDRYGPANNSYCNFTCSNNSSQKCGGDFANSVYSVCPVGYYGPNCFGQCHCVNGTGCIFNNGFCSNGCQPGWRGITCSDRDCSVESGTCNGPHELCETVDLKYTQMIRCKCAMGYYQKTPWEKCTDIDECSDTFHNYCGIDAYNCTNTDGGFVCSYCSEGFGVINGTCVIIPKAGDSPAGHDNGKIIGAIVGSFCALLLIIICIVIILRCRKKRKNGGRFSENLSMVSGKGKDVASAVPELNTSSINNENESPCYVNCSQPSTKIKVEDLSSVLQNKNASPEGLQEEFESVPKYSQAPSNIGKRKELKKKKVPTATLR